jgi:acyl phosphate:glycerol-3-phosphate acyltransferase
MSLINVDLILHVAAIGGLGYYLGSIPSGVIIARLAGLGDLRKIGSGNIGATNVLRTGKKGLAALTLVLDMLKGAAAVLIGSYWGEAGALIAGAGAFLGHLFSIWLGFHGGKGVATYLGALLGLYWPAALAFASIWLGVALATRYSSLAALVASAATPVLLGIAGRWPEMVLFVLLTIVLYARHAANIGRLMRGEEARIGSNKL